MVRQTVVRKRVLVACLVSLLLLATGVAGAVELTVWSYSTQQIPESAIRAFEAEHPGVTVTQLQPAGAFTTDGFYTASAAGVPPDLIHTNEPFIAVYEANNLIIPLTSYIEAGLFGSLDEYFPGVIKNYKGETWFIPHRISANTNLYNVQRFEEAGLGVENLPTTWEEFQEAAKRLTVEDRPGALLPVSNSNMFTWFVQTFWQAGGELFDADGRLDINNSMGLEGLEFYTNAFRDGYALLGTTSDRNKLANNEVAMMTHGNPTHINSWRNNGIDWIQPGPTLTHRERAGFGSVAGWSVTNGPNQDLAAELLAVALRKEHVVEFLAATNLFPVRRDIGIDYFAEEHQEWAQIFLNEVPYVRDQPLHPAITNVRSIVARALIPSAEGTTPPSVALEEAERLANAFLEQEGY